MNIGPVTLELTELKCELLVRHGKKLAYLVGYTGPIFLLSFHPMKALLVQMFRLYDLWVHLYLLFNF